MSLAGVLAVAQVATAVGLVAFWVWWFSALKAGAHEASWLPEGYVEHERAFALPDHVLAVVLVAAAVGWWVGAQWASGLSLLAAGMAAFLAMLDASYFTRHGMWAPDRGGLGNIGVVAGLSALAIGTLVVYL